MEIRFTLRLSKKIDEMLEKEKKRTGLSKNQLILKACEKLLEKQKK